MEFGSEVNEHASKPSDAPLPHLDITADTSQKDKIKEPDVSREALPRLPQGVLNVTRPEPEARHRDPEHPEQQHPKPERSAADATDAQEDTPQEAAGSGGDVPPKDPPKTAQAGKFGDGDNDRGDNGTGDRQDDVLEAVQAAAEPADEIHGAVVEAQVDDAIAKIRADAEKEKPDEGKKPPVPGPRKAPSEERVEEGALGTPRLDEVVESDTPNTTDTPNETADNRKDPPSHFPSDKEIEEGLAQARGLQEPGNGSTDARTDSSGSDNDADHTDGIPHSVIDRVMGDVGAVEAGNRMEGILAQGDEPPGHEELADQEQERQTNDDASSTEEGDKTTGKSLSADDVRSLVEGPGDATDDQASDPESPEDDPVGQMLAPFIKALEHGLGPISAAAAKELGDSEQFQRDFAPLDDTQDIPGPEVNPDEFNVEPGEGGDQTSTDIPNDPSALKDANDTGDKAPKTEAGDQLDKLAEDLFGDKLSGQEYKDYVVKQGKEFVADAIRRGMPPDQLEKAFEQFLEAFGRNAPIEGSDDPLNDLEGTLPTDHEQGNDGIPPTGENPEDEDPNKAG